MKKHNFLFIFFLGLSLTCNSQVEKENSVLTKGKSELIQGKKDGKFSFILSEVYTENEVEQNSSYYKLYFSVSFDVNTHEAIISMKTNDEKSRHIISRFLTSFGIEYIKSDDTLYRIEEFYNAFLK